MARYIGTLQATLATLGVVLLALLQGLMILLALSDAQIGAGAATMVGAENYWTMLRSLEFRRALFNTLLVTGLALAIIVPAGNTLQRFVPRGRWLRAFILVAVVVPVAMPGALGVLAWRSTLDLLHVPLGNRWLALLVFAVVQAWRAFPLAVAVRNAPIKLRRQTHMGLAGAVAAYWIVADISVVMLLTGGAPYNATHLLASWGYATTVTSGQVGLGAAMEMTLLGVLRLLGIALGWLGVQLMLRREEELAAAASSVTNTVLPPPSVDTPPSRGQWAALALVLIWLVLPLFVVLGLARLPWQWGAPLRFLALDSGYFWWLTGTLLLAAGAAAVTIWVAPPVAQWLVQRSVNARKAAGSGVLALVLTSLPVAFVPLLWLNERISILPSAVRLELLYVCAVLCLGVGFAALAQARLKLDRWGLIAALALTALLIVTQEFSNTLALDTGAPQTLNSGMVNNLAFRTDVAPATTALAILLPSLLFGALYCALVWVIHKRRALGTEIPFADWDVRREDVKRDA
jgi:multiple sugar transport system permease protein